MHFNPVIGKMILMPNKVSGINSTFLTIIALTLFFPAVVFAQTGIMVEEEGLAVRQTQSDRLHKLQAQRQAQLQRLETLSQNYAQRTQVRQEAIEGRFDDQQTQRLQVIKKHAVNLEARLRRVNGLLYGALEKISAHINGQSESGFDMSDKLAEIDAIEAKLESTETQISELTLFHENLEALSPEQVASALADQKVKISAVIAVYKEIRTDLFNLIKSIK